MNYVTGLFGRDYLDIPRLLLKTFWNRTIPIHVVCLFVHIVRVDTVITIITYVVCVVGSRTFPRGPWYSLVAIIVVIVAILVFTV